MLSKKEAILVPTLSRTASVDMGRYVWTKVAIELGEMSKMYRPELSPETRAFEYSLLVVLFVTICILWCPANKWVKGILFLAVWVSYLVILWWFYV